MQQNRRGAARRRGRKEKDRRGGASGRGPSTRIPRPSHQQAFSASSPQASTCVLTATSVPGTQEPSETLRAHRLAGLQPPKVLTGHLPSPFTLLPLSSSQLTSLACTSWAAWHRGHHSTWGEGRHLGLPGGLPAPGVAGQAFLLCLDGSTQHTLGVLWFGWEQARSAGSWLTTTWAPPEPHEFCLSEVMLAAQQLQGCAWCYLNTQLIDK